MQGCRLAGVLDGHAWEGVLKPVGHVCAKTIRVGACDLHTHIVEGIGVGRIHVDRGRRVLEPLPQHMTEKIDADIDSDANNDDRKNKQ